MPTETIFAWTGATPPEGYPAFVNISRDENGVHTIMVRGPGNGSGRLGCAELSPEVLQALAKTLRPQMPKNGYATEAEGDAYTLGWFDGNEADPYGLPRWRHKKRGTHYTELGTARLQMALPLVIEEGEPLTVYRGDDGVLWARPEAEFKDGRFEQVTHGIPTPAALDAGNTGTDCGEGGSDGR